MTKKRVLGLLLAALLALPACGGEEPPPADSQQKPPPPVTVPEQEPTPPEPVTEEEFYFDITSVNLGEFPFELMLETVQFMGPSDAFEGANESLRIDAENQTARFEECREMGEGGCYENGASWADIWVYPVTTDRYLSAVTVQREHMIFRLDTAEPWSLVDSFVYDQENDCMVTLDAALEQAGTTWEDVEQDVKNSASAQSFGSYEGLTSMAFYMDSAGEPVFLVSAIVGEDAAWPTFFTWYQGYVEWSGQHPMTLLEVDPLESLFCRSGAVEYDGAAMISEEEAMEILREIYEVQEDLAQGMLLSPYGTTKYLDDAEHLCIAVGNDLGNRFETVWVYAVSYGSVYRLEDATGEWIPIGFG